jgi:hypothetical protein
VSGGAGGKSDAGRGAAAAGVRGVSPREGGVVEAGMSYPLTKPSMLSPAPDPDAFASGDAGASISSYRSRTTASSSPIARSANPRYAPPESGSAGTSAGCGPVG